jgi:hypothetical protein
MVKHAAKIMGKVFMGVPWLELLFIYAPLHHACMTVSRARRLIFFHLVLLLAPQGEKRIV